MPTFGADHPKCVLAGLARANTAAKNASANCRGNQTARDASWHHPPPGVLFFGYSLSGYVWWLFSFRKKTPLPPAE
ncbi:MAG: hypothetical protein ABL865_06010 [Candidatus Nitrotoga sp.]